MKRWIPIARFRASGLVSSVPSCSTSVVVCPQSDSWYSHSKLEQLDRRRGRIQGELTCTQVGPE